MSAAGGSAERSGPPRIHVTGAAGAGVSTLGRALAEALGVPHLDTDKYYWVPSDPPFTRKRTVDERLSLVGSDMGEGGWVLAGSADGWGDPVIALARLIVFVTCPAPVRLARLKRRERVLFGDRIDVGGDMERIHADFMVWAAGYDDLYFGGRSLARHRNWLRGQRARVIELAGTRPVAGLVAEVVAAI
jgi:adenylate kinase family enzyme